MRILCLLFTLSCLLTACSESTQKTPIASIYPRASTGSVPGDADDCCIWIDRKDPKRSVIIGNDKKSEGGLYTWDLAGKQVAFQGPLNRPVNVDIAFDVEMGRRTMDIVACPLRGSNEIKLFRMNPQTRELEDITTEDGIPSGFDKDTYGFALYHRPSDGKLFGFVSQKHTNDIHQIAFTDDGDGKIAGKRVRKFGGADQKSFVEGICVDDALGWVYCADEQHAVLKYDADPDGSNELIHKFALDDAIEGDREGISLIAHADGTGFLLLSSQGDGTLKVYRREGDNAFVGTIEKFGSNKTDGVSATSYAVPPTFPKGIVACHNDDGSNFVLYSWEEANIR